ncbi:efflux RND transporter periplasmic adaptor subunit [Niveispirillum sp.]|uniref:efflux RND transporter periplasmic adaptor subunit n=1 Tax=Niveispirillum sp. TaxID=1917217 RepID=UPI001B5B37DB|nr:efflux RND transporter periplasmic adaptor subunit [Niveispirillum sp.]MBP7335220.1 efflux RND transporter periplasmic adaptor subunit [Niveispirillum sp.]
MNITKKHVLIGVSAIALLLAGGFALTSFTGTPKPVAAKAGDGHDHGEGEEHEEEGGAIHMDAATITRSKITLVEAGPAPVSRDIRVMGTVVADADRMVHVTLRVSGIVTEVHKRLGEPVQPGDVLLVLDSRDLAEAKAEYLSALRQESLAATTLSREEGLWRKQVSAEQDYLTARAAAETAAITLAATRQRLTALGLSPAEIKGLDKQPFSLGRLEVRSPVAGRVIGREAVRGELLAAEKEVFSVADLSSVWVELPVYAADLPAVKEGQPVSLTGQGGRIVEGKVIAAGATLDPQTGAARVVAALDNKDGIWRPGDFGSGTIQAGGEAADIAVPSSALQVLNGDTVVFVRNAEGFEPRVVEVGRRNSRFAEITFGLFPGEQVATGNTFLLKAEASRGEASHSHAH